MKSIKIKLVDKVYYWSFDGFLREVKTSDLDEVFLQNDFYMLDSVLLTSGRLVRIVPKINF